MKKFTQKVFVSVSMFTELNNPELSASTRTGVETSAVIEEYMSLSNGDGTSGIVGVLL
jgi:non-canonical (house-cleaning) NTP pyrophosphatase